MLDHVPGLLTSTIAAIVSPRKTSSETRRSENVGDIFSSRCLLRVSVVQLCFGKQPQGHRDTEKKFRKTLRAKPLKNLVNSVNHLKVSARAQTLPGSAGSKSLRSCAPPLPARGSCSTTSKSRYRNERARCRASKDDS